MSNIQKHKCRIVWGQTPQLIEIKEFDTDAELRAYTDGVHDMSGWLEYRLNLPDKNGKFEDLDSEIINSLVESGNYTRRELWKEYR